MALDSQIEQLGANRPKLASRDPGVRVDHKDVVVLKLIVGDVPMDLTSYPLALLLRIVKALETDQIVNRGVRLEESRAGIVRPA